jgi:magnesium-transporting ATPase (P-type)
MIKAAHVGVGITGVEGTAATQASDYAIGTFHMLHPLLLVHGPIRSNHTDYTFHRLIGYWSYLRTAGLVTFIFYKTMLLAGSSYYFGFVSGFSVSLSSLSCA